MDNYYFWEDLFDTYQSLSDFIQALWLIVPASFIIAILVIRRRCPNKKSDRQSTLIYTVHQNNDGDLSVYHHDKTHDGIHKHLPFNYPNEIEK